jgi:hypothetical protein
MSTEERQPEPAWSPRRWYQYSLRTLFVAVTLAAVFCSLFAWHVKRTIRQKQCVQAIYMRGGYVRYDFEVRGDDGKYDKSLIPGWLLNWLGKDFFHRVARVDMEVLMPSDWERIHEEKIFNEGCLVPGRKEPNRSERWGSHGVRKLIWPATEKISANDWARAALRQVKFGCDRVVIYQEYCRNALKLDPHNIEANLLFGECPLDENKDQASVYLETVLKYADPNSLEYVQAQNLLLGKHWTFSELCDRISEDGKLH